MNRKELINQIFTKKSFLCVGLDPDINKIPKHLLESEDPIFEFLKQIIDTTAPYSVAYKPNIAFFECLGIKGLITFDKIVRYIKENYPEVFIIADAKRGDIGNTAKMYAKTFFEEYDVDAITVAPYMGEDSVQPFLDYENKWTIVLALTSNKGSHDFQFIEDKNGKQVFQHILSKTQEWGNKENLMFVVGATQGSMFSKIRELAPDNFLLVPGVGAQGGSLQEVCKYGITKECGLLVNSSRGIIFASADKDFATVAGQKAKELQEEMAEELKKVL